MFDKLILILIFAFKLVKLVFNILLYYNKFFNLIFIFTFIILFYNFSNTKLIFLSFFIFKSTIKKKKNNIIKKFFNLC